MSRSSFSEARAKLPWQAVESLLECAEIAHKPSWKGHNVYAFDGTYLTLPNSESIQKRFPHRASSSGGKEHYPRARLLSAIDVFTGQPVLGQVDSVFSSERGQLRELISRLRPESILLLDRGFESIDLQKILLSHRVHFVSRARVNRLAVREAVSRGVSDQIFECEGLKLRMLIKRRQGHEALVIITSLLDAKTYTKKALISLYKRRWQIETQFRRLKQTIKLPNFHAASYNGIMQEIFTSLLMLSLLSATAFQALGGLPKPLQPAHSINFASAAELCWRHLHLFISGFKSARKNKKLLRHIFKLLRARLVKDRPGRQFKRISRQPENRWIKRRRAGNHVEKGHWKWSNKYR